MPRAKRCIFSLLTAESESVCIVVVVVVTDVVIVVVVKVEHGDAEKLRQLDPILSIADDKSTNLRFHVGDVNFTCQRERKGFGEIRSDLREREGDLRERDRQRETQTETETDRDSYRDRQRKTDRERQTDRDR